MSVFRKHHRVHWRGKRMTYVRPELIRLGQGLAAEIKAETERPGFMRQLFKGQAQ